MIIIQLDSEQLSNVIQNAVRKVISETSKEEIAEVDPVLTIQQAAEFLSLSVPTIYSLVSRSSLPVSKRGKRLYFSKQELTHWIKEGRKKTHTELQAEAKKFINKKQRA